MFCKIKTTFFLKTGHSARTTYSNLFVNLPCVVTMLIFMHMLLRYKLQCTCFKTRFASSFLILCFPDYWLTSVFYIRKWKVRSLSRLEVFWSFIFHILFSLLQSFLQNYFFSLGSTNYPILIVIFWNYHQP